MPPRSVCDDSYLGYRVLFVSVVIATVAVIVVATAAYFMVVLTLDPAPFETAKESS